MTKNINSILKTIHSSIIIIPIIFATIAVFLILFSSIPYITENNLTISIIVLFLLLYIAYISMKREKELIDANNKLQDKFKNMLKDFDKNVIASTLDCEGNIIYASDLFCKLSGYSRDELIGKKHNIIRHKDMSKEFFKEIWDVIDSNKVWKGEIKNSTKNGGYFWLEAVISPVFNTEGKIIEYNSISHDITNKKELESLNKSLKEKISLAITQTQEKEKHMLNQSKMAQMGEMLSMIAHQWKQPLAAISSTASALELKMIIDDCDHLSLTTGIKDIQAYSQHLSLTINDFRNFFKDSKLVTKTTFENIIDDAIQIVKVSLQNDDIILSIQNDFKDEFCVYENEFKQVILNLIKNAEDAIIESGTGLGLYMSKTIIENHCLGSLECFNTQEGARFKITLDPNKFYLAD